MATAAATIRAANTTPLALLQLRIRSLVHASDPDESPFITSVAVRVVSGLSPATTPCFLSSFRAIHFSRSRGSIPSSSIFRRFRGDEESQIYVRTFRRWGGGQKKRVREAWCTASFEVVFGGVRALPPKKRTR